MKISLILIPLLLFMTSCTIDWNDEKDNPFNKSLECSKINSKMLQEKLNDTKNSNLIPKEVFYSKKYNSCLFTAVNTKTAGNYKDSPEGTLFLFDFNNSQNLSLSMPIQREDFDKKLIELKGE